MEFDLNKINTLEDLKLAKNAFNNSDELKELMSQIKIADPLQKAELGKKIQLLKKASRRFFWFSKAKTWRYKNSRFN